MKANEALIAWTPAHPGGRKEATSGQVKVGPLLGEHDPDWTAPYACTGGAAYTHVRQATGWKSIAMLMIAFQGLVVGDGIEPKAAHEAFLAIDEYRQRIARDIPGAEDIPEGEEEP